MANTNIANTLVNGHTVSLFSQGDGGFPGNAAHTDWLLVKFDQFISLSLKEEFQEKHHLEIYERIDDNNVYLCKYKKDDLGPVINNDIATHLTLYPNGAVPVTRLSSSLNIGPAVGLGNTNGINGNNQSTIGQSNEGSIAPSSEGADKLSLVVALHPSPNQTPQQVLHELETRFRAEHLDSEVETAANLVRVRLDRRNIQAAAGIDSVRTIREVQPIVPFSILADGVLGTNSPTTQCAWNGLNEIVHVADSGFDKGSNADVHPAFTGRVLAATTSRYATNASDLDGHGTHVAGSVLGDLSQSAETDTTNMRGTAPRASLVSLALDFGALPPLLDLFTQVVGSLAAPMIHTNSWGKSCHQDNMQGAYGAEDAKLVDQAMADNPQLCILFAAGNDGRVLTQTGRQQQVGSYASAKNSIVVGACYSTRPLDNKGRYSIDGTVHKPQEMTTFSSRGPTLEGQIGIDVVAPGRVILSARSRSISDDKLLEYLEEFGSPKASNLLFAGGTSMSTPAVAGCVACLRQAYRQIYGIVPSGAMLKALIIHGAMDLEGTTFTNETSAGSTQLTMTAAPNTFQGYGMVNMPNSIAPLVNPPTDKNGVKDSAAGTGKVTVQTLILPTGLQSLVVTLAYTDIPAKYLQNIIKLEVQPEEAAPILPLQPNDPLNQTPPMVFAASNVAKVVVSNPVPGTYKIVLDVKTGSALAPYAVVWSAS